MGRYDENIEGVATRTMTLFYLFDTSGSMGGTKIGQVNYAMKDIPQIIMDVAESAPNANIMVAAATFSSSVDWITPQPMTPEEFKNNWRDLSTYGLTSVGAALKSLNEKLSRQSFMGTNPMGYLAPGIIILSDGAPTDEWESALADLRKNNWFKNAIKVAFAVGDDADKNVLAQICGSSEAVISIDDPEKIRQYIKFVTATVSKTGTTSQTAMNQSAQQSVVQQIQSVQDDSPVPVDVTNIDDDQW